MAENRGPWLSTATALFFGWAFMSLGVRVWVILEKKHHWARADTGVSAAFVSYL